MGRGGAVASVALPTQRQKVFALPARSTLQRPIAPLALGIALILAGCVVIPIPLPRGAGAVVGYRYPADADPGPAPAAAHCPTPTRTGAMAAEVVTRVNAERQAHGLAALRSSSRLDQVAQAHACDNAARTGYSHTGSDGSGLQQRLLRGGYHLRLAAENTGLGFDTPDRLVQFWMASPHHRSNILNPGLTEVGVGLADGSRPAWVLDMAKPR